MTSLKDRLRTLSLRRQRLGEDAVPLPSKDDLKTMDKPLPEAGYGGRKREIAAIERHHLIAINLASAPFEWLASHGKLETDDDNAGIGNIRFSAGIKFRDLLTGAEPAGLKSANLEGSSGGGGTPVLINDFKMDCMNAINGIRRDLARNQPKRRGKLRLGKSVRLKEKYRGVRIASSHSSHPDFLFNLLAQLIYKDEWVFEKLSKKRQKAVMDQIHNGLDQIAVYFGMITPREYDSRWNAKQQAAKPAASRAGNPPSA